jgi:cytochrome P450/surfactin synthase thioesterase subunit
MSDTSTAWRIVYRQRPHARMRLYCFPFGGHGASAYHRWPEFLPPDVELRAVQLPGRQERVGEPCITDCTELVATIADVLAEELREGPYALFGHCVGGLISYHLAQELARRAAPSPQLLAVSGFSLPGARRLADVFAGRSDSELVDILGWWGTPTAVLDDPDLRAAVLTTLRADAEVWLSSLHSAAREPLQCAVAAYGGVADRLAPLEELAEWRWETPRFLGVRRYSGSHLYLTEQAPMLVRQLVADLLAADEPRAFTVPERLDVDPDYARLRRDRPLTKMRMPFGDEAWLATRYADVRAVLVDRRFSRAAVLDNDEPRLSPEKMSEPGGILSMDPPEHARLRKLIGGAFTPRRVERLRPAIEKITADLLDRMETAGAPADLVQHFALPLPITVISELMGVPVPDRRQLRVWSEALVATTALSSEQRREQVGQLQAYMVGLIAQRRRQPTDDLLGALVMARDEHGSLSETELVKLSVRLLVTGHETTASQIVNFVHVLLTHPEHLRRLRTSPELIPAAVEELLRYVPLLSGPSFPRYATEDVELSGVLVRAGEPVLPALDSADRDESVFPDPDKLDFTRTPNPHLAFGYGPHHCVGAQLARVELQVALGALLERLPGLRLDVPEEAVSWKKGSLNRSPTEFVVAW